MPARSQSTADQLTGLTRHFPVLWVARATATYGCTSTVAAARTAAGCTRSRFRGSATCARCPSVGRPSTTLRRCNLSTPSLTIATMDHRSTRRRGRWVARNLSMLPVMYLGRMSAEIGMGFCNSLRRQSLTFFRTWVKALRGCYFPGGMFDTAGWFGEIDSTAHATKLTSRRVWAAKLLIRAMQYCIASYLFLARPQI
jgi:hypothetical protein